MSTDTPGDYTCTLLSDGLTIQISFTPGDVNERDASCQISHNATNVTSPLAIKMTGFGTTPALQQVKVPNVHGFELGSAATVIVEAGLKFQDRELTDNIVDRIQQKIAAVTNPKAPVVFSQDPPADTPVDLGTTVTLYYYSTAGSGQ